MLRGPRVFSRSIKTVHKELKFGNDARLAVLQGAKRLHDAVVLSLGPKGRNVLMEQQYNAPRLTKDGVSIAEEVKLDDPFQNMGCQLLKDVTHKANAESGDGTTTSTVLAYAILNESIKRVSTGCDANEIRKGVLLAVNKVVEYLESMKRNVSSHEELKQIAIISCNGDEHLGGLIADAVEAVGKDGIITVEKGNKIEDELEVKKGLRYGEGFIDAKFGNLVNPKAKVELENPLIMLHRGDLRQAQHILPALSYAQREKRPLLIVTEGLEGDAKAITLLNKLKGIVNVVAVRCPGFGDARHEFIQDIEVSTGAKLIDPEIGDIASAATKHSFGSASTAIISSNEFIIVDGKGSPDAIKQRISMIEHKLENDETLTIGDKEQTRLRLSKLTNGAAIIRVGGINQLEVKEKKDRLDDAFNSTYSAMKGGIIPGGGIALFKSQKVLKELLESESFNFDVKLGVEIVHKALSKPFDKILSNSGLDESELKFQLFNNGEFSTGVDARTGEIVDMYAKGIIDPFNTVKASLVNSSGVTSLLATTEVAITNVLGEKEGF